MFGVVSDRFIWTISLRLIPHEILELIRNNLATVIRLANLEILSSQAVYSASYGPVREVLQECYNEVSSGNEIRSVVMQGARLNNINTGKIDGTFTWKVSLQIPKGFPR